MKRYFAFLILLVFMSCSCQQKGEEQDRPKGFEAVSWNGHFVEAMSDAYDDFLETDNVPTSIRVEGVVFDKGEYMDAGCRIIRMILDNPQTWQEEDVPVNKVSCSSNHANNTLDVDEMSFEDFLTVMDVAVRYVEVNGRFPNYCTVNQSHTDADGSQYSTKMTIYAITVALMRVFNHYVEYNEFPEKVSTWHSDFLRSTANCKVDDEVVVSSVNEIVKGKATDYEKAKAIFEFARDEWEYEDYYNTEYGAVKTITGKKGNCCDMSHAIIAMSRAIGIPARYRHAQCQYSSSVIGHVMAEVYVDGQWYLCDATNNKNTFGNHESWRYMVTFNGRYNELPF